MINGPKIHGILGPRILSPLTEDLISSGPKGLGLKLLWTLGPRITGPNTLSPDTLSPDTLSPRTLGPSHDMSLDVMISGPGVQGPGT